MIIFTSTLDHLHVVSVNALNDLDRPGEISLRRNIVHDLDVTGVLAWISQLGSIKTFHTL